MKTFFLCLCLLSLLSQASCQQNPSTQNRTPAISTERNVGGSCECCEVWNEWMPKELSSQTRIAALNEKGEKLEINGTIYQNDGKTPAIGVILYVYHTDADGYYSRGNGSDCAKRHGLLRGWMKTGADGTYLFKTIRPASYPGTSFEQHIHPIIKEPGLSEYWIDEFVFADDPLLTENTIKLQQQRGGSGIVYLSKNKDGVWVGKRNIVLGLNVPGYN